MCFAGALLQPPGRCPRSPTTDDYRRSCEASESRTGTNCLTYARALVVGIDLQPEPAEAIRVLDASGGLLPGRASVLPVVLGLGLEGRVPSNGSIRINRVGREGGIGSRGYDNASRTFAAQLTRASSPTQGCT